MTHFKKASSILCLFLCMVLMTACNQQETKTEKDSNSQQKQVDVQTNQKDKTTNQITTIYRNDSKEIPTVFTVETFDQEPSFHTDWLVNTNYQQITVEGKGIYATEEGIASLLLKNTDTNQKIAFRMKDSEELGGKFLQHTPKAVEWIDNDHVFVIIGYGYGTPTKGGNLYELNIKDNTMREIIKCNESTEEIASIRKNPDNTFTYYKHIYDDEALNEGHYEAEIFNYSTSNRQN